MGPWGSLVILPALGEKPPAGSFTSCNPPEKPVTPVQIRAAPPFFHGKSLYRATSNLMYGEENN